MVTHRLHLRLHVLNDEADGHLVLTAAGDDDVGVNYLRSDVEVVRRLDEAVVLGQDADEVATALSNVPLQPAREPDVRVRVHEDFHVQELPRIETGSLFQRKIRGNFFLECGQLRQHDEELPTNELG